MISRVCSLLRMQPPVIDNRGLLFVSGATVPIDGTDGYQTGAIFQHTDGGTGTAVYINEGTVTSCTFVRVESPGGSLTLADLQDVADGFATRLLETGTYANTASAGVVLSSSNTRPVAILTDDGGVNLDSGNYRPLLSRTLLTIDQTGSTITPVRGQLKLNTGIDVATGIYAPVQGYIEVAGTSIASSGATLSCISASLEIGTALTAASGGEVAGVHIETTGAGTLTATGTVAGLLIDKASGAADWPVGISVLNSTTAISVGASTTGVLLSGAITTGISITSTSTTDGIKISGTTPVDGVEVSSACSAAAFHVSGGSAVGLLVAGSCTTAALHITGDQVIGLLFDVDESATDGIKMSVDTTKTLTEGIEISGAGTVTTGIVMNPTTLGTGINIGACTTAIAVLDVITSTPDAAGTLLDFILETEWVSGTLVRADFGGSTTLSSAVVGVGLDFGTNVVATSEQSVTGFSITLPQSTNVAASPALKGLVVAVSGAMTAGTSGDPTFTGVEVTTPAINCTADTIVSTGVSVTTGTSVQTGGTSTTTAFLATGGTLTTGTVNAVTIAGTFTTGVNITATVTTGLAISGTTTTAISIGTVTTAGITFTGSLDAAVGLKFTSATFTPETNKDNRAIELGSRSSEIGLAFVGGAGAENFEPIQMNFNCTGTNPASTSTINIWQGGLFLDTHDLGNVRLKWSDLLTTVNFDCKDVYTHQAEIKFGAAASAVGGEVAVLGLVLDAGAGAVTCSAYRGINITMRGAGTPGNAMGIFMNVVAGVTVASAIHIEANGTITTGLVFDCVAGAGTVTNLFSVEITRGPAVATADDGDGEGSIRILVDGSPKWLKYWADAAA